MRVFCMERIPDLSIVARDCSDYVPALKNITRNYFLPMVVGNLASEDNLVQRTAQLTLFSMIEQDLITKYEVEALVCQTVLVPSQKETMTDTCNGILNVSILEINIIPPRMKLKIFVFLLRKNLTCCIIFEE